MIINFSIIFFYQILFLKNFLVFEINRFDNLELFSLLFLIYSYFFLGLFDDKYNFESDKKILFSISIILVTLLLNKNLIISNFSISFYESRIFLENSSIILQFFVF